MIEHLAQFPTYQTTFNYVIAVSAVLGIYVAFVWELHQDFFGVVLVGKGS
jgi:preprotein translocase subunit SecE